MTLRPALPSLLCVCLCLAQCASKDPSTTPVKGTEDSADGPAFLVGIIEFVNPDQNFVLVKTQGAAQLPTGHTLTALDATGALSEIVVTPERKGSHLTADIKSGNPRAGNLVVYRPKLQENPAPVPPGATQLAPLSGLPDGSSSSSGPNEEWRDGQPPPLEQPAPAFPALPPGESPIPLQPTAPIPLDPLPEGPPRQP